MLMYLTISCSNFCEGKSFSKEILLCRTLSRWFKFGANVFNLNCCNFVKRNLCFQGDIPGMLSYCQKVALSVISSPGFRNTVSFLFLSHPHFMVILTSGSQSDCEGLQGIGGSGFHQHLPGDDVIPILTIHYD